MLIIESKIGFTYQDLTIANVLNIIFGQQSFPKEVQVMEGVQLADTCGHATTVERLDAALRFVVQRQHVYGELSPIHRAVCNLLGSHDYFPEDPKDFEEDAFGGRDDLGDAEKALLSAHSELLRFWQAYAMHRASTDAIVALSAAYGAEHTQVFTDDAYPCIYHRGMTNVDPDVLRIVDVYNHYKDVLGITPGILTADNLVFPTAPSPLLLNAVPGLTVNIPTLAGRIWFEGKPESDQPGGATLREA